MVAFKNLPSSVKIDQSSNIAFNGDCGVEQRGYKYQCYKVGSSKGVNADVNNIEFYCFDNNGCSVVVSDKDCQLERTYVVGQTRWLGDFDTKSDEEVAVLVESQEQVIEAWATGKVWF